MVTTKRAEIRRRHPFLAVTYFLTVLFVVGTSLAATAAVHATSSSEAAFAKDFQALAEDVKSGETTAADLQKKGDAKNDAVRNEVINYAKAQAKHRNLGNKLGYVTLAVGAAQSLVSANSDSSAQRSVSLWGGLATIVLGALQGWVKEDGKDPTQVLQAQGVASDEWIGKSTLIMIKPYDNEVLRATEMLDAYKNLVTASNAIEILMLQ